MRAALEGDYTALRSLWGQLDQLHGALQPRFFRAPAVPRPETELAAILRDPDRRLLVAVEGERVVGTVQVRIYDTPNSIAAVRARRGYVEDLVVDERHRGGGVGRLLMEEAGRWCRGRGAQQIVLMVWEGNEEGSRLYAGLGYREVSRVLVRDAEAD